MKIAAIATRDQGVVARRELLDAGLSSSGIGRRVKRGLLIPEYEGVYRVGHQAPSQESSYMAATKAGGPGTYIARRAAGHALGLVKGKAPKPEVISARELTIPRLKSTRCRTLRREDTGLWKGIPITSPARTLVDLAPLLSTAALARACHEAGVLHDTTPRQVEHVLARVPNAKGATKLRAILTGDEQVKLSELERAFFDLLRAEGLPLPITNRRAGSKRVDCRWPDHKLTVELNSFRFHNSRHSWEGDYRREREARGRGDEFRRFTWADVFEDPAYMLGELRELLRTKTRRGHRA